MKKTSELRGKEKSLGSMRNQKHRLSNIRKSPHTRSPDANKIQFRKDIWNAYGLRRTHEKKKKGKSHGMRRVPKTSVHSGGWGEGKNWKI